MSRLRAVVVNASLVVASLALSVAALELVLRFLPVAWAPPVRTPTAAAPVLRYAANSAFTWSLGWNFYKVVHGRTNAQGFVADYEYDSGASSPLVAVVGDSYIEAMQVPFARSLTGLLQKQLGARGRAYAFAISGAAASQYIAYARYACQTFRPQRLVISVVGNDFDESIYAHRQRDGLFNLHPEPDGFGWSLTPLPPPRLTERIARNSALALYLARNVGVSRIVAWFQLPRAKAQGAGYVGNTDASAPPPRVAEGYRVIDWFVDALKTKTCVEPAETVVVVDAPRPEIYVDATVDAALPAVASSYFGLMRARLIERARAGGFRVVDLAPPFRAAFERDHRRFENPTDAHWNEAGHALVADLVRDAMRDWAPLSVR